MNGNKPAWASMTVWSSLLAALFIIAGLFGYEIDLDLQGDIEATLNEVLAAVLAVLALVGRFRARKNIGKPPQSLSALAAMVMLPLVIAAAAMPLAACSSSPSGPGGPPMCRPGQPCSEQPPREDDR